MLELSTGHTRRENFWTAWLALKNSKGFSFQYDESSDLYTIWGYDGPEVNICYIWKSTVPAPIIAAGYSQSQNDTDKGVFEGTYKALGNLAIDARDVDGTKLSRNKAAPLGWTYQLKSFEFETSQLNSVYSKDQNNSDLNDVTIKFYDSDNVELTTQIAIDLSCVKTVVDIEPTFDYEVIGGLAKILIIPTVDVRLWIVAVPDIAANLGGSKVMVNGFNFRYLGQSDSVEADGRASKRLAYSATYHTNKLRFILRHPAGHNSNILMALEMYKI